MPRDNVLPFDRQARVMPPRGSVLAMEETAYEAEQVELWGLPEAA